MAGLWSLTEKNCFSLLQQKQSHISLLQIHAFILRNTLYANPNILTKFIAACSSTLFTVRFDHTPGIRYARRVFDHIPDKGDSFLCNTMVKSHNDHHQFDEAVLLYRYLRRETHFVPDVYTYLFLSKSCCSNLYNWEGRQLHNVVIKSGFSLDLFLSTTIVDM